MKTLNCLLRLISLIIAFFSIWFCVIGIGFIGIAIAQDLWNLAERGNIENKIHQIKTIH